MASTSVRGTVKHLYAGAAHGAGRVLTAAHVLGSEPPPRSHRRRHWLYSLTSVHDSGAMIALDVPWWTYRAIDDVEEWLAGRDGAARVFEYGSGASTAWLARRSASVHSVEHDVRFASLMEDLLAEVGNAEVAVRPPVASANPVVASAKEGYAGLDFSSYVAAIDEVDGDFDLVVVDGRARERCLTRALDRLAPDGLVVFDNTRRRRYRRAIEAAPVVERRLPGLTPTLPYPDQTSLLRRS
jgi:predicted O-methyltransferase YrrM